MPLNGELRARNARFLETGQDRARLPVVRAAGLLAAQARVCCASRPGGATPIEVELWALRYEAFGRFVADIPPPLVDRHARARRRPQVKGFLVEANATKGARDISELGGWRAFVTKEMNGTGR